MSDNYLLTAFHFRVLFKGLDAARENDSRFQSVTGLKLTNEIPSNPPVAGDEKKTMTTRFNPVVLRRAVERSNNSTLRQWVLQNLNNPSQQELPEVLIQVLNEEHKPEITIRLKKVSPAGWQLGELNAANSELLMEEISLNYKSIEVVAG